VSILKKLGTRELIFKYAKWVLEAKPKVGLSLFEEGSKSQPSNIQLS